MDSAGDAADGPPEPLDGAISFAPAGELVPVALRALDRGGTLAVAGIWLSDIPALNYDARAVPGAAAAQRHRQHPRRRGGVPPLAARLGVRATTTAVPDGRGATALADLAARPVRRGGRAALLTAAWIAAISAGPTRQQPPTSRAPAASQEPTRPGAKAGSPTHRRAAASQPSPLFG